MPNGKMGVSAQYFYLAQLQAVKGNCKCKACELLRRGADLATAELLEPSPAKPKNPSEPETVQLPDEEV